MENLIIAIDQSTSATKAMLFNERCEMLRRVNVTQTILSQIRMGGA